jgi:predicted DCC family thiol-disulfide oxidoreductase YuxK/thiol-disulfide isomerase/thioredoxin
MTTPRASMTSSTSTRASRARVKATRATARRAAPSRRGFVPARAVGDEGGAERVANPEPEEWRYAYLFDGACPVCQTLKSALEGTGKGKVWFVDISDPRYDPKRHQNVTFEEAMETIHVLKREGGEPLRGLPAIEALFAEVGMGWAVKLATMPAIGLVASVMYKLISSNRLKIGGAMGAGVMALGRVGMEVRGEKASCSEGDECRGIADMKVDADVRGADDDDDEVEGTFESMFAEGPKAIFGAYASGGIVSAAIVNVRTGELESELITAPLEEGALLDINAVGSALRSLTKELKWQGSVAIALPGVWHADEKLGGSSVYDAMESLNPFEARREREETEEILRTAVGLDVTVVTGAEAHGYGHQDLWGEAARRVKIGQTLDSEDPDNAMSGLTGVVTAGHEAVHVALFKDGVLRTNADFREADLAISWIEPEWENAKPPADDCEDEEQWKAWATRLAVHLAKVENCRCARGGLERWVVSGSAARNFEKWSHLVPQLSVVQAGKAAAPLVKGGSNSLEGVRGAAAGGSFRFRYVADIRRVRSAIGKEVGRSPQLVSAIQLRELFAKFGGDVNDDAIDLDAFVRMVAAMGVRLPEDEVRELVCDIDVGCNSSVTFDQFETWYKSVIGTEVAQVLHTESAVDQVLEEETGTGRAVVLQVGFTSCQPCKRFLPHFENSARQYRESCRFVRIYGNENASTIHLARDRLAVKSTPTFFVFKDGVVTHMHSGSNAEKFDDAIAEQIGDIPRGSFAAKWIPPAPTEATPTGAP